MAIAETYFPARGARRIDWTPYAVGAGIGILSWVAFAALRRGRKTRDE